MGVKDCINVTLKKNEVTIKIDIGAEHKNVIANLTRKTGVAAENIVITPIHTEKVKSEKKEK